LGFHQNKCHHRNAPDTRRQCTKATDQWAQRVAGRTNSLAGRPHLTASHGFASWARSPGGGNKESKVSGHQTWWPTNHVARPAGQHLACYQLNQVGNSSLDPYKYPPTDGIQDTTLYLLFSNCKGFDLVVVVVSEIGELLYPYLSL
jgi:hypothetical protein